MISSPASVSGDNSLPGGCYAIKIFPHIDKKMPGVNRSIAFFLGMNKNLGCSVRKTRETMKADATPL